MNIIKRVAWLGRGTVGVVEVDVPVDGLKYYISNNISGDDEQNDAIYVAQWGGSICSTIGDAILTAYGRPVHWEYT